jgi:hypothetical protein
MPIPVWGVLQPTEAGVSPPSPTTQWVAAHPVDRGRRLAESPARVFADYASAFGIELEVV